MLPPNAGFVSERVDTEVRFNAFIPLAGGWDTGAKFRPGTCPMVPGSALGSLLSVALSSDQVNSIIPVLLSNRSAGSRLGSEVIDR